MRGDVIAHDVGKGVVRLMSAARDFSPALASEHSQAPGIPVTTHQRLFEEYVRELQAAVTVATEWWHSLVERRVERGDDRKAALRANYELRPAGPASHPRVVRVVRVFWLECTRLNDELRPADRIPPEVFLLRWLQSIEQPLLVGVLSGMPYWPVGMDEHGTFC
jgi:hypothetical protein